MAAGSSNSIWVSAEIIDKGNIRRSIFEVQLSETLSDLYQKFEEEENSDRSIVARIFDSKQTSAKRETPLNAPVSLLTNFSANSVQFEYIYDQGNAKKTVQNSNNAFQLMMKKATNYIIPKPKTGSTAPDKLFNDILELLSEEKVGWSPSLVKVGEDFVALLKDTLWHITCHFDFFKERGAMLDEIWYRYANRNDWRTKKDPKPTLSATKIKKYTSSLAAALNSAWMNSSRFSNFRIRICGLNHALIKVLDHMERGAENASKRRKMSEPARIDTENTALQHINATSGPTRREYNKLFVALESKRHYEPILLCDFEPEDRRERYKWLESLSLPITVSLLRRAYGGQIGTMNFLWKVPSEVKDRDDTKEMQLILNLTKSLPDFHSRQMEKDFINRYRKLAKTSVSVLRSMYREISGDASELNVESEKESALRIGAFISGCDSSEILIDLRKLNGRPKSPKYDDFWEEIQTLFNEYQTAVHERRHGNESYLPFAISIRELVDRVKRRRPDIAVPSHEWVRLQFSPTNPYADSAMKYTARFEIKYMVQRRQMRYEHPDGKYAQMTFKYLKEFAVTNKDLSRIIFLDDKAVVPVGNPGLPVSTNVRRHNKSLGASSGILTAADHDWHVAGIVSSVLLCPDIPDNVGESFFNGQVVVTNKCRIFEPSTAIRHAREMGNVLQDMFSSNSEKLNEPVLLMYTDGGGDHNVTHASVQLSLLCLFLELDLDMLIAVRTCPTQSWVNPAERCMYLLNLALQNTALERETMEVGFEDLIRNKTSMKQVRDKAERNENLEAEFLASMESPIKIVNHRYERMCLKDTYIKTYKSASNATIENLAKLIAEVDPNVNLSEATKHSMSNLPQYQKFFQKHCLASTYAFQVKKCEDLDCAFCTAHPIRMSRLDFSTLDFLPFPMLDSSKEHFKDFLSSYGTVTSEKDRPSSNLKMATTEEDAKNKSLLTVIKVRNTIKCVDCQKPRCVYAGKALSPSQATALQHIKEAEMYKCGSVLFPPTHGLHGLVIVRTTLACEMPVESNYFSATTVKFPDLCNHCGGVSGAPLVNDDKFKELKKQFQRVRSYCEFCKRSGKEPTTWGAMHAAAKKKSS